MREREFQHHIISRLQEEFPGSLVLKNDPLYIQGIPDIVILYEDKWAMLEVKLSINAKVQPNQLHYIERLNEMSFAAIIAPENEEDVIHALQSAFGVARQARLFEPQQ